MAWYNTLGRVGLGAATLGASEIPGAKGYLLGGQAASGMQTDPQTGQQQRNYLTGMLDRQAPRMDVGPQGQVRDQQMGLAQMLTKTASGQQAGAGEMAVNRQVGQATAAQQAQAQMARGANSALASRNAARTTSDLGVQGAGMAAQAQMQDQTNAQGQLGQLLGATRAGDIGMAQGNLGAQMGQQQLQLGALAQMLGVDEAQLRAQAAKAGVNMQDTGMLPGLLQTGGQMAVASDERVKQGVYRSPSEIDYMLDNLEPVCFRYKEARHGEGVHFGIMAQDLERSASGKTLVFEDEEGVKNVNLTKAVPLLLATVARLNERIKELEKK